MGSIVFFPLPLFPLSQPRVCNFTNRYHQLLERLPLLIPRVGSILKFCEFFDLFSFMDSNEISELLLNIDPRAQLVGAGWRCTIGILTIRPSVA